MPHKCVDCGRIRSVYVLNLILPLFPLFSPLLYWCLQNKGQGKGERGGMERVERRDREGGEWGGGGGGCWLEEEKGGVEEVGRED